VSFGTDTGLADAAQKAATRDLCALLVQPQASHVVKCLTTEPAGFEYGSSLYEAHLGRRSGTPHSKRIIALDHEDRTCSVASCEK